jgi:hypothetical protein
VQLIQLVANLPPTVCGVGDYALRLAQELRAAHGFESSFVVCKPGWPGHDSIGGFRAVPLKLQEADSLLEVLATLAVDEPAEGTTVLVQFSAYGFERHACPQWLVSGLQHWKQADGRGRLVTFFHEDYPSLPPWRRMFWYSRRQRDIAARLARLSDVALTNTSANAEMIRKWDPAGKRDVPVLPVFSTLDELAEVPVLAQREKRMVVFGRAANRVRAYKKSRCAIEQASALLSVDAVYDIGEPMVGFVPSLPGLALKSCGTLPTPELRDLLLGSFAGFVDYPRGLLGKSTIFSNYCACGVLPVLACDNESEADGLVAGEHYFVPYAGADTSIHHLEGIALRARQWYGRHTLPAQANQFARLLA